MDTKINKADQKAAEAKRAWMNAYLFASPPVYPNPGFFETTTAVVDNEVDGEATIVTHETILSLMALPRFDWREVLRRSDDQWATAKGKGWGEVQGLHHYFTPRTDRVKKILSMCGEYQITRGHPLLYDAAGLARCGDCLHLSIMESMH